jgi:hypothetical protein
MPMIEIVAAAAQEALKNLGWRLERVDTSGRGRAVFVDGDHARLIFEIGSWWPPGAHHLDDEPGIVLFYQEKHSPRVHVPFVGQDRGPDLTWSSSGDDVRQQTLAEVRNFASFLAGSPDRRSLYDRILDRGLETRGVLGEELFATIKKALADDQATTGAWAEKKLAILRQHLLDRGNVFAFDPAMKRLRSISTVAEFESYVRQIRPATDE